MDTGKILLFFLKMVLRAKMNRCYYSPSEHRIVIKRGTNWLKDRETAALAGFNEAEDGAEHITTGFVPDTAGHLLAVFDFAEIALTKRWPLCRNRQAQLPPALNQPGAGQPGAQLLFYWQRLFAAFCLEAGPLIHLGIVIIDGATFDKQITDTGKTLAMIIYHITGECDFLSSSVIS